MYTCTARKSKLLKTAASDKNPTILKQNHVACASKRHHVIQENHATP